MLSLQLIMLYGLVVIGIIYVTATSSLAVRAQDTERQAVPRSRCPFIRNSLVNGRVKIRSRGRIAKFICNNGYELVGRRFATCVRGQWNNPIPICVTNGCPVINHPPNGELNVEISDALVTFSCDAGYVLRGSSTVYCTGTAWNDTVPICDIATTSPELTCDFEDPNICGWSHDRYHNFDWRRHQFSTPSGHVGTGPSYDHTLGKNNDGYYMYTEASPPRVVNDSARLFSPVYFPETTPACFVFWYHMYGATTGSLRVYLKKESQVFKELLPAWERIGPQGNLWLQGYLPIPQSKQNFQIVIEGIRGTGYVGDTAIDDVALYSTPCEDLVVANINRGADSCKNRCFSDEEVNATCSCKQGCEDIVHWCCDDYEYFCTDSANRTDFGLFSIEPSLKRTSIPSGTSLSPIETFAEAVSTPESTFTPIIDTSETVIPTSLNLSSSNTIYQTGKAQSPSTIVTSQTELSVETISVTNSSNFPPILPKEPSSTVANVSLSTKELVYNTTTSQITTSSPTTVIIEETMQKRPSITSTLPSTTKKQIVIPLPSVNSSPPTTAAPVVKSTTTSPKSPTAEKLNTNAASTTRITISSTSTTASTMPQLTTSNRLVPPRVLTPASTTKSTLTSQFTSSKQSTTFSTRLTSLVKDRQSVSTESSSSVPIKTTSSILDKRTSTDRYSKLSTTSKQYTITTPTTSKPSTFAYYEKTKSHTQRMPSVTTTPRKFTTTINTSTSSTSVLKTPFNYPKQNNSVVFQDTYSPKSSTTAFQSPNIISSSTSVPEIRTSENCPEGSLRFRNGRCFPPWTNNVYSSQAVVAGSTEQLETSTLASKITDTPLQLTELINTKGPKKLETSKPFPSSTRNPGIVYESAEVFSTWKPDFKSRTKYRDYIQNPSEKSPVSITMIVALAVGVISALALIVIVGLYIFCKKRKVEQSKLSEDSEMRFLSDCEIIEFADASTKLRADSA